MGVGIRSNGKLEGGFCVVDHQWVSADLNHFIMKTHNVQIKRSHHTVAGMVFRVGFWLSAI